MTAVEPLITAREAQAILGCCRSFLTAHADELGAVKMGKLLKFTRSGLAAYQERRRVKSAVKGAPAPSRPALSVVRRTGTNPVSKRPYGAAPAPREAVR